MRIVIVGGGISGLAAARRALDLGADVRVVEQSPAVGGKLRAVTLPSGAVLPGGADAFAVRDPQTGEPTAAAEWARRLGLELVTPGAAKAAVALDGTLVDFPAGTLMGIPADAPERVGPLPVGDVAVGALVRDRFGDEVVERWVDPMLGGVYAGRADTLSLAVTLPALAAATRTQPTLSDAVKAVLAERPTGQGPLFASPRGGMAALASALADAVGSHRISVGRPVRELHRVAGGWRLTVGSTRDPETLTADAVVLAVPARPAARLMPAMDIGLDYASVALVVLALPEAPLPELSGFLVPPHSASNIKAVTFLDRKWPHLRQPGRTLVRLSLGRYGEEAVLQRPDADLVAVAAGELADLVGTPRTPLESAVCRWGGALPQYAPGHLDRVAAVRAALPPGLALAGAAWDGVGVPACVRSGVVAAETLVGLAGRKA